MWSITTWFFVLPFTHFQIFAIVRTSLFIIVHSHHIALSFIIGCHHHCLLSSITCIITIVNCHHHFKALTSYCATLMKCCISLTTFRLVLQAQTCPECSDDLQNLSNDIEALLQCIVQGTSNLFNNKSRLMCLLWCPLWYISSSVIWWTYSTPAITLVWTWYHPIPTLWFVFFQCNLLQCIIIMCALLMQFALMCCFDI